MLGIFDNAFEVDMDFDDAPDVDMGLDIPIEVEPEDIEVDEIEESCRNQSNFRGFRRIT